MSDGFVSLRQFARIVGVDERAVRKAIAAGDLSSAAVGERRPPNACAVNLEVALQEWERRRSRVGMQAAIDTHTRITAVAGRVRLSVDLELGTSAAYRCCLEFTPAAARRLATRVLSVAAELEAVQSAAREGRRVRTSALGDKTRSGASADVCTQDKSR
jgi:hypothetical protein